MELKWLEDYLSLVDSQNFTVAAASRNVSQPAFSRRIQALESWLGIELVDRSKKPMQFTAIAKEHETAIRKLVDAAYQTRSQMQSSRSDHVKLTVAAQHSLLVSSFLPSFLEKLSNRVPNLKYNVISENMDNCVSMFLRGTADVLIVYEYDAIHSEIPRNISSKKVLGDDELILVGHPKIIETMHPIDMNHPLPILSFPTTSFFGHAIRVEALPRLVRRFHTVVVCESSFAVGLREMALAARGVAWLPRSIIEAELKRGALKTLTDISPPIALRMVAHISKMSTNKACKELVDIL
jgi:DNA-binding transcriptional LysR family regulator